MNYRVRDISSVVTVCFNEITKQLSANSQDVESIITLEARPAAGETDAEIVAGAWDFKKSNRLYEKCLKVFSQLPQAKAAPSARELQQWAQLEKNTWLKAVSADPLLPDKLLPDGYLGKKVWRERVRTLASASRLIL